MENVLDIQLKNMKYLKTILICISILAISAIISFLFKGEYFIIRVLITTPFVYLSIRSIQKIWKKINENL